MEVAFTVGEAGCIDHCTIYAVHFWQDQPAGKRICNYLDNERWHRLQSPAYTASHVNMVRCALDRWAMPLRQKYE
jgi:hypothetical protein